MTNRPENGGVKLSVKPSVYNCMRDCSPADTCLLLLDSHSVVCAVLRETLQDAGYQVITAGDLGGAVDRLNEVRPDLLIIRPYINSMPGYIAADYLRTRCPGLPVLIVGGFLDDDRINVQNAIRRFHVFPKPFSREDLLENVSAILKHESERRPVFAPRKAA